MDYITIYATEGDYKLDESRVVLVTKDGDGVVKFQNKSKRERFHICDLGNGVLLVVQKVEGVEDETAHRLVSVVAPIEFLDAPPDVQRFIVESGRFPKTNWVRVPTTALYSYETRVGGTGHWVRVAHVKPMPGDEDDDAS